MRIQLDLGCVWLLKIVELGKKLKRNFQDGSRRRITFCVCSKLVEGKIILGGGM